MKIHIVATQWSTGTVTISPFLDPAGAKAKQSIDKSHPLVCEWSTVNTHEIETPDTSAALRKLVDLLDDEDVMICDKVAGVIEAMEDALHTELGIEATPIPKKTFEIEASYLERKTSRIEAPTQEEAVAMMTHIMKELGLDIEGSLRVKELEE